MRKSWRNDNVNVKSVTKRKLQKMYGKRVHTSAGNTVMQITDTHKEIGTFPISDIIFTYGKKSTPDIIVERVYRNHYTMWQWYKLRADISRQILQLRKEKDFNVSLTYARSYIDLTYSRQEWWQWLNECGLVVS